MSHKYTDYREDYLINIGKRDRLVHLPTGVWRYINYTDSTFNNVLDNLIKEIEEEICDCLKCIAKRILNGSQ